mgnify:CR=1 FL=1
MKTLWTEQYRPKIASEYVFRDNSQRQQVETWIAEKSIPHLSVSYTHLTLPTKAEV